MKKEKKKEKREKMTDSNRQKGLEKETQIINEE